MARSGSELHKEKSSIVGPDMLKEADVSLDLALMEVKKAKLETFYSRSPALLSSPGLVNPFSRTASPRVETQWRSLEQPAFSRFSRLCFCAPLVALLSRGSATICSLCP